MFELYNLVHQRIEATELGIYILNFLHKYLRHLQVLLQLNGYFSSRNACNDHKCLAQSFRQPLNFFTDFFMIEQVSSPTIALERIAA